MAGLVYSRTDSGLLVAEHGAQDERAVARALKDYDRDLRLVPQAVVDGRLAYKVYRYAGPDRPAEFICFWGNATTGEAWPLSHRLLDKVRELDRNTPGRYANADELNAGERGDRARKEERDAEDLSADWTAREGRSALLPRGQSLRRARSRTGYHDAKGR